MNEILEYLLVYAVAMWLLLSGLMAWASVRRKEKQKDSEESG